MFLHRLYLWLWKAFRFLVHILLYIPVKAVGVLCVLGISFGIGTYVLYKIYNRFIVRNIYQKISIDCTSKNEAKRNVDNVYWYPPCSEEIMGSSYSSPAAHYKPELGVLMYLPRDGKQHTRNRFNISEYRSYDFDNRILNCNLQTQKVELFNGENLYEKLEQKCLYNDENDRGENSVQNSQSFNQLHNEMEESGYVEDDGDTEKYSVKGNFSPALLFEKNLQIFTEFGVDLETDGQISQYSSISDALNVNKNLRTSSVLLTDAVDEISSNQTNQAQSLICTESHVSDINSDYVEPVVAKHWETADDYEQLSSLPYSNRSTEHVFAKKIKQKLAEIASTSTNLEVGSNHSSRSLTPEFYLMERIKDGASSDRDNSISGISSPELELLHNESTEDIPVVNTDIFTNIEDEIHVVEDEFENISKVIHTLSSKYSDVDLEHSTEILNTIFQKYPKMRVHNLEHDETIDSRNASEIEDAAELSWDPENLMGHLYGEMSEQYSMNNRSVTDQVSDGAGVDDSVGQDLSLNNNSVNCSVELNGSLYEDDFHLHLGTKAIPNNKENHSPIKNIGEKYVIHEYGDTEWKGDTDKARLMREAYRSLPDHCQCCCLRQIRGDNYCGIRSTLYQALVNGLSNFNLWNSKEKALEQLALAYNNPSSGIKLWNFANRLTFTSENLLEVMQHCVNILYAMFNKLKQCTSYSEREACIEKLFNSDLRLDLEFMEGVKLLMSLTALHLHNTMEQGNDVPVFAWLIFARDTSETVADFVKNHLNTVGDSGGLEQVEMCLLGFTLGMHICVYRLQQYGQEDFISHYPEDGTDTWPVVSLIAEDDRHYNIPVECLYKHL